MELRQYLQIAQRWAWLLILGLVLGGAGGYYLTSYQTPVYKSATKVLVSSSQDQNNAYLTYLNDQQLAQTYIQLLTTQPVLAAVGEKLGYPVRASQITAQLITNTQLIQLSVEDTDPQRAAEICNTLVGELISQNEQLQANRFTASEESLKAQLEQVQSQITTLQFQVADVSEQSLQAQEDEVKAEIDRLEVQILATQKEISRITPARSQGNQTPVPTSSPEQTSLLQEKQLELDQLKSTLNFYQSIYLNLVGKGSPDSSLTLENVQLSQMQSTLDLYQQIYSNLLTSYESIRLARLQNTPNVVQVEMAAANDRPIRPQPLNNIFLGAAVGLMVAAGIVLLIEYLDDTIKTPKDITRLFDVPVIGYIAEMSQDPNSKSSIYVARQPRSPVTEAFRSLRTNIDFSNVEHPLKTILVASANPSEGKTTVAVNLAMVYALSGKRVTIVDADMRRPQVHHYLGMSNYVGLSNIISESEPNEIIERPWKETSLSVITSGNLPQNPAELLGSEKMVQFIESLKQETHITIIDCPPFVVSDAAILAAKVDGVLLVVQPGKTQTSSIEATLEQLSRVDAMVLGFVFNRIPRNRGYYYGGYQHYSHYYSKGYSGYFSELSGNGGKAVRGGYKKSDKREESEEVQE